MAKTEQDYRNFQLLLEAIERENFVYLADEGIDRENVVGSETDPGYWNRMYDAAVCAAIGRAEDYGLDVDIEAIAKGR